MNIKYFDKQHGIISEIIANGVSVPFYENTGPAFYIKNDGAKIPIIMEEKDGKYISLKDGILYSIEHLVSADTLTLTVKIKNTTGSDFTPDAIGLKLGINSYMTEYPQWNDKFFPSFLRCEKTHFTGYFMSPLEKAVIITADTPVAAWELDYNTFSDDLTCHFGHRIYTGNLLFTVNDRLPERHPDNLNSIKAGEEKIWLINITPADDIKIFKSIVSEKFNLPMLEFENYTVAKGEKACLRVFSKEDYCVKIHTPSGKIIDRTSFICDEHGVYTATVTTKSGFISEAKLYCRHDYGWYLKAARKNAVYKPQKASTHTESWYGHFSSFLAKKHYPDKVLDDLAKANFDEIMPHMYNFETGEVIIIPTRVQNVAGLISLLVDLYESDTENNRIYLGYANNMADFLIQNQTPDGAYRKLKTHYTSVIYIAKSMLELAICEKQANLSERYEKHYNSAKAAVLDLEKLGEKIGTEGEHTLEDGMITCSALQLGFFALTLPEEERAPFIRMAEHLMSVHKCLEELHTPDCRMRGATLRFWEAQYDVMIRGNMMNTPHGWTSWKNYATYYLYLLTGKEEYLKDTIDTMGACLQMIDENENLRWAFIKDPYNKVKVLVPDKTQPIADAYTVPDDIEPAYRGKFETKTFGEEYVDLISGWYRTGEAQKITGGYQICPLYFENDRIQEVDNQGGACDNDVHEHFKCLEETLLKKAFVIAGETVKGYNCNAESTDGIIKITPYGECDYVHVNTDTDITVEINGAKKSVKKGMEMIDIR